MNHKITIIKMLTLFRTGGDRLDGNKTCGECGGESENDYEHTWVHCSYEDHGCDRYYHTDCLGGDTRNYDCDNCSVKRWSWYKPELRQSKSEDLDYK